MNWATYKAMRRRHQSDLYNPSWRQRQRKQRIDLACWIGAVVLVTAALMMAVAWGRA